LEWHLQPHRRYALKARSVSRQTRTGGTMSLQSRLESLKTRHASLDNKITEEDHRPRPDPETLSKLKLEKLRLKEEMGRLKVGEA
jgi:hypothetical protein